MSYVLNYLPGVQRLILKNMPKSVAEKHHNDEQLLQHENLCWQKIHSMDFHVSA